MAVAHPPTKRAAVLADIDATAGTAEGSVRKIAARHGVGVATLRRWAKDAGMSDAWADGADRVAAANAVKAATVAEKRARLQSDLLDDAQALRQKLFAQVVHLNVVKVDMALEEVQHTILDAGPQDWRATMGAVSLANKAALDIAKLEQESAAAGQASGLLEQFADDLRARRAERDATQAGGE